MNADGYVDLRSDTVTAPTERMRRAMASAEVGDDCYREDPTVNRLQDLAAELLGYEAALFVPSGTMANQIAVKVLTRPGGEVLCDADCHLIHHESGATAMLSQVQLRGLPGRHGVLDPELVRAAVRPPDVFQPDTVLVSIENTHNAGGGTVWTLPEVEAVVAVAREAGIPVFCDGARLFNACVAAGVEPSRFAAGADVVTVSLYKGLCAPVGSLLCGARQTIERAWVVRRILGGAMRQAGILAAAGIVALESMVERLAEDHDHAARLAEGLAEVAGDAVPLDRVQTNMVLFDAAAFGVDEAAVLGGLRREGILAGLIGPGVVRFVTHRDVDRAGIERAVSAFRAVIGELRA